MVAQSLAAVRRLARRFGVELTRIGDLPACESLLPLHLHKLFRRFQIDLVLDIGAHKGEFALSLRRNGYAGRIISFEPVGASFEALSRTAARDPLWTPVRAALGDENGTSEMNITRNSVSSSLLRPNAYAGAGFGALFDVVRTEAVDVHRLDSLLPQICPDWAERRIYLKIDSQGSELAVLNGAAAILPHVPAMQCEGALQQTYTGMPDWQDIVGAAKASGYGVNAIFPCVSDPDLMLVEVDGVFIRMPPRP